MLRVTVHVLDAPVPSVLGAHVTEDSVTAAARLIVAVCDTLPSVAVTTADWSLVIVPAVTVKVPVVAAAATVTEAGVVSSALLSDSVTVVPPVGADLLRVTVQVLEAPEASEVGAHATEESVTAAARPIVAVFDTLPSVAVTTADWSLVIVPAVSVKVPVVAAAATVTEAGVVSSALLSDSVTVVPPVGAAPLSVTVHVELPALLRVPGVHDKAVSVGARLPGPVTVPALADAGIELPLPDAAMTVGTEIKVEAVPAATVTFTVATTPLAIVVEFNPEARQL